MRGSRPSHMIENTLFRDVFSNPWYLDQVAQTVVMKTDEVKMQTTTLSKQKVVKRSKI